MRAVRMTTMVKSLASARWVSHRKHRGGAPEHCPKYERIVMIASDFEAGSLAKTPTVEDEPDAPPDDIAAVLAEAEDVVEQAEPAVIADTDSQRRKQPWWRRRRHRPDDGDDFRLSDR
jgi:hypothetical protein